MALDYREFRPSASLSWYVDRYWTLEGRIPADADPERILPDGRPEVVWNLGDPFFRHGAGAPRRQAAALLVGQITGPLFLRPTGRIHLLGVRFRPAALGAFLGGVPALELTDGDFPLEDVVGPRLRTLAEEAASARSSSTRSAAETVAVVERRLREDLRHALPPATRVAAAVSGIARAAGSGRVDKVAAAVGWSPRQLQRVFLREVGIGPKRFARIVRFQHLVSWLGSRGAGGWPSIAVECGYYDQAHLIRDVREFTGEAPGDFVSEGDRPLTQVFLQDG